MMRNATAVLTAGAQFLPFFAKTVTSIMRYTGLLVAVLFTFHFYSSNPPGFAARLFLIICS